MNIEALEVANVLRQALRGEIAVRLLGDQSWKDMYCGNLVFMFGDWQIVIFNDCIDLDYVDSVIAPDGRTAEYEDWFDREDHCGADPVDLLGATEGNALLSILESCAPEAS